jgi:glycosyltransferase involved in cell wall biosynthesis
MSGDSRPVALVTGEVSPYRREPFRMLAAAEGLEVLAWNDSQGAPVEGLTIERTSQAGAARLVASGRYRAVICGLGGRVALPGSYLAARRSRIPFVLWASLWAHPSTAVHRLSRLPTSYLYRHADAVVTYGSHVSEHVSESRGKRGNVFEAAQAVDAARFAAPVPPQDRAAARERAVAGETAFLALFAGRLEREKGVDVLLAAWREAALPEGAVLAFAGDGPLRSEVDGAGPGVSALGSVERDDLPALYAAADALVLPSVPTATFREPWGLVVNEAMHAGTPVIASDAVGAVAGGLVQDGRNGLVAPAGDAPALAARLRALALEPGLRERLGAAAADDVKAFSHELWVEGMSAALQAVGASKSSGGKGPLC